MTVSIKEINQKFCSITEKNYSQHELVSIYIIIFDILTENKKLSNYSTNDKGICFYLNNLSQQKIKDLDTLLNRIITLKSKTTNDETNRSKLIKEMKSTMKSDSDYKSEINEYLNKTTTFSTKFQQQSNTEYESDPELEIETNEIVESDYESNNSNNSYNDNEDLFGDSGSET